MGVGTRPNASEITEKAIRVLSSKRLRMEPFV